MLSVSGINQFYGESQALWDMSLEVPEGECTCLMGRNGVGKTTMLDVIMGGVPIRSGKIEFNGEDITKKSPEDRARSGIAYVPQSRGIFGQLTVEENLRTGLVGRKQKSKKIPDIVYELFPVLKDMGGRRGGDLSGGQQQQLAIGRGLVLDPTLLILDEPTEGIQPNIVAEISGIICKLNKEIGLTVLLVEQKLPFARRAGDTFTIMDKGRVVAKGTMSDMDDNIIKAHLTV